MTDGQNNSTKKPDRPNPEFERSRLRRRKIFRASVWYFFTIFLPLFFIWIYIWDKGYLASDWRQLRCERFSNEYLSIHGYRYNVFGRQDYFFGVSGRGVRFPGWFVFYNLNSSKWDEKSRVIFRHKAGERAGTLAFDIPSTPFPDRFRITPECWHLLVSIAPGIQAKARQELNPKITIRFQKVSEF